MGLIDFERLESEVDSLRESYRTASPFEHVVIDEFLNPDAVARIREERFFERASTEQKSSDLIFAKNKIENPRIESISDVTRELRDELLSRRFEAILSNIVGQTVFVDPSLTGGGLHQGGKGSYLEMHADFTRHPSHTDWIRELNILLYLNPDYDSEWGGALDLRHAQSGSTASVAPLDNRAVIMLTKPHTLHGYKAIRFPDGRLRTSIAVYAYSLDNGTRDVAYSSTTWRPGNPVKRAVAALANPIIVAKQKLFGSRTAQRARR